MGKSPSMMTVILLDPPKRSGQHLEKKLAQRKKAGFKTVTKSTTDPDCGVFVKGKHQRQFAYEAHTVCDKNGYQGKINEDGIRLFPLHS